MRPLWQDLRYGARMLAANRGFTGAAVLCLALGIGATTAIFSVVNSVILRPLPYAKPAQLARIYTEFPAFPNGGLPRFWTSAPEFADLERDLKSWSSIEAWRTGAANLSGGGANEPMRVGVTNVTGGLLASLGIQPALGRSITPQDDLQGAPQVAVISHGLWERAYASDPSVIGRDVQLNGAKATIAGVMPAGFQFPPGDTEPADMWVPFQLGPPNPNQRSGHFLNLLGRLKDGVSLEQARQEAQRYVQAMGEKTSQNFHGFSPKVHPLTMYNLQDEVVGGVRRAMLMLLGAVGFVLLIACVNVANLLLARAEARQREIAVRTALGAGTARLVTQFVIEGVLLSGLGAALGLLFTFGGLRLLVAAGRQSIPRASEIGIDATVFLVTLAVAVGTGVFFGLAPLLHLGVRTLHDSLKAAAGRTTSSESSRLFRDGLVVSELALALVLLIGSGLMVRGFWKLLEVHPGFDPEHVLTMQLALPRSTYNDQGASNFWTALEDRVRNLPGVESAAMASGLPPDRPVDANDTMIEGFVPRKGGPIQNIDFYQIAGSRYFETMHIRLLEGRVFDDRDGQSANPVAVINKKFADTFWPGESAIGHRIRTDMKQPWISITGVVEDAKNAGLEKAAGTELYLPMQQAAAAGRGRQGYLMVRTKGDPLAMAGAVRAAIQALDAALPVARVRSMDQVMESAQARPRFLTLLLTLFSGVALALAAIGLYGVIAYSVARRTSEFGIRMAMGAQAADLMGTVLRRGAVLGAIGILAGLAGALLLSRFFQELLFGVSPFDPATFGGMAALLLMVTLVASLLPALRATRVDPMIALRYE